MMENEMNLQESNLIDDFLIYIYSVVVVTLNS